MIQSTATISVGLIVLFLLGASFANGSFKLRLDPADPEDSKRMGMRIIVTIFMLIGLIPSLATAESFIGVVTRLSVFTIPVIGFFVSNRLQQAEQPLITRRMVSDFFWTILTTCFFVFALDPFILFSGLPISWNHPDAALKFPKLGRQ